MNKNNPKVWMELLSIFIETDCPLRAFKVFQYGIKSLESDAMPLCQMMETFLITQNETMLLDFYDQATYGSSTNISLIFRVKYLKWFKIRNTLTAVRKLFKELIIMSPPCKHLYIEMISYEQSLTSVNLDRVSKLYNNVCCNLGQGDVELWSNYIRFVYKHVQRCTAKKIYKSSLPFLGPELFGDLTKEYENIKKEIA
ncbi:uncharacterized protein LOC111035110 [Myzus persicae]|uniref:uncharacterized protein LOC111035110 n=1 Tax=Myzus persicae TaxID=13164 RepID=UPI000B9358C6|nr:uncharacterized protein LOC111035110 [Myzus persicae]